MSKPFMARRWRMTQISQSLLPRPTHSTQSRWRPVRSGALAGSKCPRLDENLRAASKAKRPARCASGSMALRIGRPASLAKETSSDAEGIGTIIDNDAETPPSFSISDGSGYETNPMAFTITKSGFTTSSYSVTYSTADGTATAGNDYRRFPTLSRSSPARRPRHSTSR